MIGVIVTTVVYVLLALIICRIFKLPLTLSVFVMTFAIMIAVDYLNKYYEKQELVYYDN